MKDQLRQTLYKYGESTAEPGDSNEAVRRKGVKQLGLTALTAFGVTAFGVFGANLMRTAVDAEPGDMAPTVSELVTGFGYVDTEPEPAETEQVPKQESLAEVPTVLTEGRNIDDIAL